MRALVTGATGFVGRSTCAALRAAGVDVHAAVRTADAATRLAGSATPHVVGDITGPVAWAPALDGIDVVVHLAARVHVMRDRGMAAQALYQAANVEATAALARAAVVAGVPRLVYVSSVKAVGESGDRPLTLDTPPRPLDAYGVTKLAAERALRDVERETALGVVVVRPPLVYGPGVGGNFQRLLALLRLSHRVPLPLGAVRNQRSLVYVENLASALVAAAVHPRAAGSTFFVRDGEDLSTPELLRRLGVPLHLRPRFVSVPPSWLRAGARLAGRGDEVDRLIGSLQVDDGPLRRELGWSAPVSVDEALAVTARSLASV